MKRFLAQARGRLALEVTTLVVPTRNDEPSEIEEMARFLASLDPQIPYHLSAYYPQYRYTLPPTSPELLRRLGEAARRHLRYVYLGNLGVEEADTACPQCGNLLVRRRGYQVRITGLRGGRCAACGAESPIVTA